MNAGKGRPSTLREAEEALNLLRARCGLLGMVPNEEALPFARDYAQWLYDVFPLVGFWSRQCLLDAEYLVRGLEEGPGGSSGAAILNLLMTQAAGHLNEEILVLGAGAMRGQEEDPLPRN